jgi:hypothetical protein
MHYNLCTLEAEAGASPVHAPSGLHSKTLPQKNKKQIRKEKKRKRKSGEMQ